MAVTGGRGNLTVLGGGSLEERMYSTCAGINLSMNSSISEFEGGFINQESLSPGWDGGGLGRDVCDFLVDSLGVFLEDLWLIWERAGRGGGAGLYLSG